MSIFFLVRVIIMAYMNESRKRYLAYKLRSEFNIKGVTLYCTSIKLTT